MFGLIEAAEEPCKEGAAYIFVKLAVVQTGLAMVGIPVGGSVRDRCWLSLLVVVGGCCGCVVVLLLYGHSCFIPYA